MTANRKVQLFSAFIIGLGATFVHPPVASALPGGCTFCITGCPANLKTFCGSLECGSATGTNCAIASCEGQDHQVYEYTVTCKTSPT
jgi:hypothetical protein